MLGWNLAVVGAEVRAATGTVAVGSCETTVVGGDVTVGGGAVMIRDLRIGFWGASPLLGCLALKVTSVWFCP